MGEATGLKRVTAYAPIITDDLVRELVDTQFPTWRDLPLTQHESPGTDNIIYRLGKKFLVRLPRIAWASHTAEREMDILARLPRLPLAVPEPIALGQPQADYPWQWSVLGWLDGEAVGDSYVSCEEAKMLAATINEIRSMPTNVAFAYGDANHGRGAPLISRNTVFQKAMASLADAFDPAALNKVWSLALEAPQSVSPVWLHGDLHGGNLIERDGKLSGLIDWGLAGVGDGACDCSAAWVLFDQAARDVFRDALAVTEAEWLRGAGWALSIACIYLAYYRDKSDVSCERSRRTIQTVLDSFA